MMTTDDIIKILVSRKPLVRMLAIVAKNNGLPTRRLLQNLKANKHHLVKEAEAKGYVRRKRAKPIGKGNHPVLTFLTPKEMKIVQKARKLGVVKLLFSFLFKLEGNNRVAGKVKTLCASIRNVCYSLPFTFRN
jgi:hypothetical protein